MGPKLAKNDVFCMFLNISSLVFPGNNYISLQTFYLAELSFSSYRPKCSQPIRLQKREGKEEERALVEFLHVDKNQSFLQVDTIGFGRRSQPCPKYHKN